MSWTPYRGDRYLDFDELTSWCQAVAAALPRWVDLREAGRSRHDRPIWMLTIGDGPERDDRPTVWIDGGTHATEFTGVMAALYTLSSWLERLDAGDEALIARFQRSSAVLIPCISPDGFQAMHDGKPFLRSSLRPPRRGTARLGFNACDVDGDGTVRWMRWRHPAGPFVVDPDVSSFMRPRTLDDDPADAYFFCSEGEFINWDGVRWVAAPREFGIDLNRNFPASWAPFSMFGMDSGDYPASEPESRAVVDAFGARPTIGAALTNHTYTGCILTQPYRDPSPLDDADLHLMEALADDLVAGSGYKVYKVVPDFVYDPKKPIVGVWADTISTVFGVPGYTVEFWDPFTYADVELKKPAEFFLKPDPDKIRKILAHFEAEHPESIVPWRPYDHPQLGEVEIGGIDYMRTIRNPPVALLEKECKVGLNASDRLLRALPDVEAEATATAVGDDTWRVRLVLENHGFLPSSGLRHGENVGASPGVSAAVELPEGAELLGGTPQQALHHLDGWGTLRTGASKHSIYAGLSDRGHRARAEWIIRGGGSVKLTWHAGRAGHGSLDVTLGE